MVPENAIAASKKIPADLVIAKKNVFDKCGFDCTHPTAENESIEYDACTFRIDGMAVKYRRAKTTPIKTGQFVTIWKRNGAGTIEPFDIFDDIDLVIISTRDRGHFGQFVFPRSVLIDKGIMSKTNKNGKMAIRVYPPWDIAVSRQAKKTQQWQSDFFLEIPSETSTDLVRAKELFKNQGIHG